MEKMVKAGNINPNFWLDKKVLITGHTGFKGSWLVLWLKHMGADVVGYALPPQANTSMFEQANVSKHIESHFHTILDIDRLTEVFKQFQPEVVIHLAAQSLVHYAYEHPIETYQTNVMGTLNVLEAIRRVGSVQSAVMVTTDKCYENKEWVWGYRENDPMGGDDPYSSSKGCAELLISSYRRSFFSKDVANNTFGLSSVRAGNVIGGGDWAENRLIPDCVRATELNTGIDIRNPNSIRPWQHVLECLHGYLLLAEKQYGAPKTYSSAWNFGPPVTDMKPVSWVVDKFVENWKGAAYWDFDSENTYPPESESLKLDSSKALSQLGWQSKWTLEKTIEKTVNWYRLQGEGEDACQLSFKQIQEYMAA